MATVTKAVKAKANIRVTTTKPLSAKANIVVTNSKALSVKADIKATSTKGVSVKANIKVTVGGPTIPTLDQHQDSEGADFGFGQWAGTRYRGQMIVQPTISGPLLKIGFSRTKGTQGIKVYIDNADSWYPDHSVGSELYSFTIPNSQLVDGYGEYTVPAPPTLSTGHDYVFYLAPWNTTTDAYADDYQDAHGISGSGDERTYTAADGWFGEYLNFHHSIYIGTSPTCSYAKAEIVPAGTTYRNCQVKANITNTYTNGYKWTYNKYEANELPENATPTWTLDGLNDTAEILSGALHIKNTFQYDGCLYYAPLTDYFDNTIGTTAEVRMRFVSGGQPYDNQFWFDDGTRYCQVYFESGKIEIVRNNAGDLLDSYTVDTSVYHVYTFTLKGDVLKTYVDGTLQLTSDVSLATANYKDLVIYNVKHATTDAETFWDYVYYSKGENIISTGGSWSKANITASPKPVICKANIIVTNTQAVSAKANIITTNSKAQSSKANIKVTATQGISAKANVLVKDNTNSQNAKANITTSNIKNVSVLANIVVTNQAVLFTIANIQRIESQGQSVKANITTTNSNDFQSKASITRTETASNQVKANIYVVGGTQYTWNVTVLANISAPVAWDSASKASIVRTEQSASYAKASVLTCNSFQAWSQANVVTTTSLGLASKASIVVTWSMGISCKANIKARNNIKVRANIKSGNVTPPRKLILFGKRLKLGWRISASGLYIKI